MYIERSINPVQSTHLKNSTNRRESFHDVLQYCLNNKSNSRPPKIEVTGVLVPVNKIVHGRAFKFKLDTDSSEYLLKMNSTLEGVAKKVEWEEVTVKGNLDLDSNIIEVEKISVSQASDNLRVTAPADDIYSDANYYERAIAQCGKLEPDYLAS